MKTIIACSGGLMDMTTNGKELWCFLPRPKKEQRGISTTDFKMTLRPMLPMFSPVSEIVASPSAQGSDASDIYVNPYRGLAGWKEHTIHSSGASIFKYDGYEVVSLDTQTNRLVAQEETALYAVSLSGGLGSAIAGERAVRRFGRDNIFFWFADVKKEDGDLYRFLHDLMQRWGGRIYYFTDGRRPEVVWEKRRIIPNDRMCPCSYELKVRHFRQFIRAMPQLPQVLIGYKADETDRHLNTCVSYHKAIPNAIVEYPLLWEPVEHRDLADVCLRELGICPPRIYSLAFEYNNCGGDCCRSGIGGRVLEAIHFPDRYKQSMEWEEMMRAKGGSLEGKAFCARQIQGKKTPITLREILHEYVPLVQSYLAANPNEHISEKTVIRHAKKWHRKQIVKVADCL